MIYIGIDPGNTGAVAAITEEGGVVDVWDSPAPGKKECKKEFRRNKLHLLMNEIIDEVVEISHEVREETLFFIEEVHSMPHDSSRGAFTFGKGFGVWIGLILGKTGRSPILILPQEWKKNTVGVGVDKDESRLMCIERWPDFSNELKLKKHHGRADALLIADYGRIKYKKEMR